ncbi:protein MODIFIED TRANSPORT TO THE VACUOLE 1 [Andrographis paniculata]|uniref:protein MODIFIED TRANSPORT TO THE VACUOLE 1 n=1 Tax=Andrographis paniculata TaxID=175694 RepID=UPI0021E6E358|nr:protein MODIFIED TRANSPORT TO THE VACUOLE 1 [Andrographis paniculata]
MEQSRRAVEAYWRSKLIDAATADEDKVAPVYKLEEICDLLRSSPVSIVKEVSEFILKRLDHKSPIVKQKALRVIKYAVGKSGAEFRREMQRHSIAVRQLIHYKGKPDPLKGDALNKAVRETAQETLSALFSSDESKATPKESSLGSRIQGFGNTNFEMPSDDRKSFISEVVDIGSATIKQGLSSLTQSPSLRKNNDTGTYRSPNLRRSLTREDDYSDQYEGVGSYTETQSSSRFSKNAGSGNWGQDLNATQAETSNGDLRSTSGQKTREERLIETIVTSGGVRLQPTRDALHVFMVEASKLNAISLGHAIETKLRSPMWQVRMKALCVLEAVLRKKDTEQFSVISSYFSDNRDVVVQCSESPQASLREKANKVLNLLGDGNGGGGIVREEKLVKTPQPSNLPDLIDTGDSDDLFGVEDSKAAESEAKITGARTSAPLIDDLFGDSHSGGENLAEQKLDDDPFADVSFHNSQNKNHDADLFTGMSGDQLGVTEAQGTGQKTQPEPFDFFGSTTEVSQVHGNTKNDVNDLMGSLSISGSDPFEKQNGSTVKEPERVGSVSSAFQDNTSPNSILNGGFASQAAGLSTNPGFPMASMGYNLPPGLMFNPALASNPMNYNAMGNLLAQQQFLATMSNFQQLGNLQSNPNINAAGSYSGSTSPFPDIFNPGMASQPPTSLMNDSKREDNRAFDFISDHLAAARDSKRVS